MFPDKLDKKLFSICDSNKTHFGLKYEKVYSLTETFEPLLSAKNKLTAQAAAAAGVSTTVASSQLSSN
jgi:hypothetical protein